MFRLFGVTGKVRRKGKDYDIDRNCEYLDFYLEFDCERGSSGRMVSGMGKRY